MSTSSPVRTLLSWLAVWACLLCAASCAPLPERREAPHRDAVAMDQLVLQSGNACGPAAVLNSFRMGDESWRRASRVAGGTERERLWSVIRDHGFQSSAHLPGRLRWNANGINALDLGDLANDMARRHRLPEVQCEIFFLEEGEEPIDLLRRVHARLERSLADGLPPVISVRRLVHRRLSGGPVWMSIDGHCLTVVSVPTKLPPDARSFEVEYLDPWGARQASGSIAIPERPFLAARPESTRRLANLQSPALEARFPEAAVGRRRVGRNEETVLILAAGVGHWP